MWNRLFRCMLPGVVAIAAIATVTFSLAFTDAGAADHSLNLATAVADVAKQNIPAVVHIEVTEKQEGGNQLGPFENDPFFQYFFGQPKSPKKFQREVMGLGTGMIMDAQGHVLTNSHVVGGATKITIVLSDGRKYSEQNVKVIGTDPKTDLAVVLITSKEPFPHVTFGDSDKMEVGEWVVAIGHPRGLDQTVTQGIISAKHRRGISDPSGYQDFLQTDAAINPGNSGGPLLNLSGEVIGVNAAIMSQSGGFEGIGFAIPSNMATHITRQLISTGKVERGWIGLSLQDITSELAASLKTGTTKGALVADVMKDGPASAAGIRSGDVIVAFEGKKVEDSASLRNDVAAVAPGRKVSMTVLRGGKKMDIKVDIATQQAQVKAVSGALKNEMGITVRPPEPAESTRYGLEAGQGVVVVTIDASGILGKSGIEPGDIILQVNNQTISDAAALAAAFGRQTKNRQVVLLVLDHRSGQVGQLQVKLP